MLDSFTPQGIITIVQTLIDDDVFQTVTPAQHCALINLEMSTLWTKCMVVNKDVFCKLSAQGQIAANGASISMTAAAPTGMALTDYLCPRGVDLSYDGGQNWWRCDQAPFNERDSASRMTYRFLGEDLYLFPKIQAAMYPFRVWYDYKAPTVSSSALSTPFLAPTNADNYLACGVAKWLRGRKDSDPSLEVQGQAEAWKAIESFLRKAKEPGRVGEMRSRTYYNGMYYPI